MSDCYYTQYYNNDYDFAKQKFAEFLSKIELSRNKSNYIKNNVFPATVAFPVMTEQEDSLKTVLNYQINGFYNEIKHLIYLFSFLVRSYMSISGLTQSQILENNSGYTLLCDINTFDKSCNFQFLPLSVENDNCFEILIDEKVVF